jgi:hypothetical protein
MNAQVDLERMPQGRRHEVGQHTLKLLAVFAVETNAEFTEYAETDKHTTGVRVRREDRSGFVE